MLIAAMTLLVGPRVHTSENEPARLYRVMNVSLWLTLVLVAAAAMGFGAYLVVTRPFQFSN